MRQLNDNVIVTQTAATVTSAPVNSVNLFACSAQITATGSAGGTLKLQASNDNFATGAAPTNFTDISGATVTVTGAGAFLIPKLDICYQWIQVVYTNTGTGTISVVVKALGA